MEDGTGQPVTVLAAVELGGDTPALLLVVQVGEGVQGLVDAVDLRDGKSQLSWAARQHEGAHDGVGLHQAHRHAAGARRPSAPRAGAGARRSMPCATRWAEVYGRFHIDLEFGDALTGAPEPLTGDDLLAFAGIAPAAVWATFARRGTHPVPKELPPPPESWARDYADMAAEAQLGARSLDDGFVLLQKFWETLNWENS